MQQQFVFANLDKLEFLDPSAFGGGGSFWAMAKDGRAAAAFAMLMAWTNRATPQDPEFDHADAKAVFGRWAGDRVVIVGDCHTPPMETDPSRAHFPYYSEVVDDFLEISSIVAGAWNRLAEDVGDFLPNTGEAQPMPEPALVALVAGQAELRRRGGGLAVRRTSITRFVVASSAGLGKEYIVTLQDDAQTCTCPVNEKRQQVCKHIIRAADFALMVEPKEAL